MTFGEVMAGGEPPLLKTRKQLRREQASQLWAQKQHQGWWVCAAQWITPQAPWD